MAGWTDRKSINFLERIKTSFDQFKFLLMMHLTQLKLKIQRSTGFARKNAAHFMAEL